MNYVIFPNEEILRSPYFIGKSSDSNRDSISHSPLNPLLCVALAKSHNHPDGMLAYWFCVGYDSIQINRRLPMKIRKDIPIPKAAHRSGRKPSYPFMEMSVGDSFQVDDEKLLAVRTAAWRANKGGVRKFRVDQHGNGWRCWRIA